MGAIDIAWSHAGDHSNHLLLDEQADRIFAMADPVAERVRKIGGATLRCSPAS